MPLRMGHREEGILANRQVGWDFLKVIVGEEHLCKIYSSH